MESKRYFTVLEANAQIPGLRSLFAGVMQLRRQLKEALDADLEAAGYAPSMDEADGFPEDAPPHIARDRARFYGLMETLRDHVEEIQETGCMIKDVEVGLVDWPSRHRGRDILLCWRLDEPEVAFWHELQAGFTGRRPISELAELPERAPEETAAQGHEFD